ncbi:hypothetical protein SAMN05421837_102748 [Amycolatopsis pretoriensis]|uniref:Uncharacterized protein n=2 Tax=Amycolatopsis pretoriensis TaxID=218821 RepID=A0A1H5QEF4_9PSEU|nr:hypothetical protein SAMN05421837_102748 [Amycolatopsis pretoriensis]
MTQRPRHPSSVIPPHPPPRYVTAPPAGTADLLAQWMNGKKPTTTTARPDHGSGLRFACYGRTSTTRHQDRDGQVPRFALAGLIHCGVCDRRLDTH